MKRSEMIDQMINFHKSTPEGVSDYHRFDMLLSRMERLGILPPATTIFNTNDDNFPTWEDEDD